MFPIRNARSWWSLAIPAHVVLVAGLAGCDGQTGVLTSVQQERDALQQENAGLKREILARDTKVAEMQAQVDTLMNLGPNRLDALFSAERIKFAKLTGGADYDGLPGDDGVTVYLQPLDADGDVLKAAGEIIVELLDTSVPGSPRSLGRYVHNDPAQLRKLWHGGFLTDHYTVKCPWSPDSGPPSAGEVLVQATFYDYLTGKRLTAAELVKVELPADPQ